MYQIRRENTIELLSDAPVWNQLSAGNPMRQATWLQCWWQCFRPALAATSEPYLVTVRDRCERLVAVLPLYRWQRRSRAVLSALGQGDACTDHVSILIAQDQDPQQIGREVGHWLAAAAKSSADYWDLLDIDGIVEGDQTIKGLVSSLQDARVTVQTLSRMNLWFKATGEETWQQYLAGLSKTNRKKTRRRCKRVDEHPELSWRPLADQHDVVEAVEQLIAIHQVRWEALGQPGSFASESMRRFAVEVAQRLYLRGQLRMPVVLRGDQPIALEMQLVGDNRVVYCYSSAMDVAHQELEPGHLITASTMQFVYEQAMAGIDMMRGDEPYKERLQGKPRRVVTLYAVAPSRTPRLRQAAWDAAFDAKQWVRSQLGRPPVTSVPF
ncbi:GNAT family N-acetyltransferase [Roseimaritima sediminicola]|uniref:GNAT family N-acetyltransferase n=1 Tax=Roseimaritima sediminicola TaxID=2662066 RepID=UPI0012982ACD|nr:GNAT family N-acetyltransferase [Roseimaritima sediminicola]